MAEDTKATVADDIKSAHALPKKEPETGRHAAYDNVLARYVGGVHDSADKARQAARKAGSRDITVRQV